MSAVELGAVAYRGISEWRETDASGVSTRCWRPFFPPPPRSPFLPNAVHPSDSSQSQLTKYASTSPFPLEPGGKSPSAMRTRTGTEPCQTARRMAVARARTSAWAEGCWGKKGDGVEAAI